MQIQSQFIGNSLPPKLWLLCPSWYEIRTSHCARKETYRRIRDPLDLKVKWTGRGNRYLRGNEATEIRMLFLHTEYFSSFQLLSHVWLCDPVNCSMPGFPVHCQLPEFTQTFVYWVGDAIQPSHPLSSPSPPAFNLSQHQGLFKWVMSSHQVAKVLEFQLQQQFFQWILRTDFL